MTTTAELQEIRKAKQQDYNLLFRGDFRDYPEHLWEIAQALQTVWGFVLPEKPKRGRKGSEYTMFLMAMEELNTASAEYNAVELLTVERRQFEAYMKKHNGIAPYTVGRPTALIASVRSHAREKRAQAQTEKNERNKYVTGQYAEFLANGTDDE